MQDNEREVRLTLVKTPKTVLGSSEELGDSQHLRVFEDAFARYWAAIHRLLARMVGDPAEAEDLALETFYRLYRQNMRSGEDFNVAGWLYRVAVNLGLHSIRSFKRREDHELRAGRHMLEDVEQASPLQNLAEREEIKLARLALTHLKPREAQLLLMRYSGASYKEIAGALNLSPTSIGPLLLRAERDFAKHYRALAQEDP